MPTSTRDRRIADALAAWFKTNARDLPWRRVDRRTGRRHPYRSLVAEVMLQQTRASRVVERFPAFIRRFPSARALARAGEQDVLTEWAGMGYYRRALNLHAAAKKIAARHGGRVPSNPADLASLPGVGLYTAGAIASIVFGVPVPAVDGNAERVILRVDGRDDDKAGRRRSAWVHSRAEKLVRATPTPGVLNEALMELGATVCLPARPDCRRCPLARICRANRRGIEREIPRPRGRLTKRGLYLSSVVVVDPKRGVLMQQRPGTGLWARMWQPMTVERDDRLARRDELARAFRVDRLACVGRFDHPTTHRAVRLAVWRGRLLNGRLRKGVRWVSLGGLSRLPMGRAQRRAIELALGASGRAGQGAAGLPGGVEQRRAVG